MTPLALKEDICKALSDKKGKDIVSIDISSSSVLADFFVICSAKSTAQVKALCDNVDEVVEKKYGLSPKSREGYREGRWIVLDYGDVVVHIFCDETRLFYHIERLWSDGNNMTSYSPEKQQSLQEKTSTKKVVGENKDKKTSGSSRGLKSDVTKKPATRAKETAKKTVAKVSTADKKGE